MSGAGEVRWGRVNALARVMLGHCENGLDEAKLDSQLDFFGDLTRKELELADDLARWWRFTDAGRESAALFGVSEQEPPRGFAGWHEMRED